MTIYGPIGRRDLLRAVSGVQVWAPETDRGSRRPAARRSIRRAAFASPAISHERPSAPMNAPAWKELHVNDIDRNRATPEARLVDSGWVPPTEALRLAIARRECLRDGIARLKTRGGANAGPILAAIEAADVAELLSALVSNAVGRWLDANLQTDLGELYEWSRAAEHALARAVNDAPAAVLASLDGVDDPDGHYLKAEASLAMGDGSIVNVGGRPARPRMGSIVLSRILIAR